MSKQSCRCALASGYRGMWQPRCFHRLAPRRLSSVAVANRSALSWRVRLRLFRAEHPTIGTWALLGTNVTVWGLYSVAPAPKPQFGRWFGFSPRSEQPQLSQMRVPKSWEELRQSLPRKDFFDLHFFASYHAVVRQGRWETVPLCTFMHVDGVHLLFNMANLFFFGRHLERVLGLGRFLCFYGCSGMAATSAQLGASHKEPFVQCIGASGGVYALMAFATCMAPWQTVLLYFVIPVPMWLVLAGLMAADLMWLRPNDAHTAHLVGAGCGALFFLLCRRSF